MAINLASNNPRVSYTATLGQTVFSIPFDFFEESDVTLYVNGTAQTVVTDYTVDTDADGNFLGTATLITAAALDDKVVIVRDIPIERTTDFTAGAAINRVALNEQLDVLTGLVADLNDRVSRSLELNDYEIASSTTLPAVDDRKGRYLSFNETTGAPETGPYTDNVNTLAEVADDIATLADLEDGTVATTALSRLAEVDDDIAALGDIIQEIKDAAAGLVGTTPISRGGTGATTAADARDNLGVKESTELLTEASNEALALAIALG